MHPVLFRVPMPGWSLPVLGQLGAVPIYSYGVMLGLSLVVGWYLTLGLSERDGIDRERMANCYVVTAIVAVLGSRAMFLVTNPDQLHGVADFFALRGGGLVAYGGFLGGFLGSWAYLKWRGMPLLPWADAAVPSLATGLAITRIGCYLFGCDFGRPLGAGAPRWLAALGTFPRWSESVAGEGMGSPAWMEHVSRSLVEPTASSSLPVHPTQLYESAFGVALFGVLMWTRQRRRFHGQVFCVATIAYGAARFAIEFLRDDPERGSLPIGAPSHVLWPACLLVLGGCVAVSAVDVLESIMPRRILWAALILPALGAAVLLRPAAFASPVPATLSTSQFIGLVSAAGAAALYWARSRVADSNLGAEHALGEREDASGIERTSPRDTP